MGCRLHSKYSSIRYLLCVMCVNLRHNIGHCYTDIADTCKLQISFLTKFLTLLHDEKKSQLNVH